MQNIIFSDYRNDAALIMTPLRPGKHITIISSSKLCARREADLSAEMMKKAFYLMSIKRNTCPVFIFFGPFAGVKYVLALIFKANVDGETMPGKIQMGA